ncbi:MAG TPA: hypothetical protein VKF80_11230 [Candidatus Eisenbacteria bacterium]|nr:hypothetical protein [Candidatus Eisenbacteria bacterium]
MSALYTFYLLAVLLWNATAAAAWRKEPALARRRRIVALTGFALLILGLTWMTATSAFGAATAVYALSAALPLSAAACAWSAVGVAREGRPWSWIAVAMNGLLAVALATRWVAYLGVPVGVPGESLSLSLVNLQYFAFTPALWFPSFVPLPVLPRPAREERGVARAAWSAWLVLGAIAVVLVLWGWRESARVITGWRAHRAPAPAARAEPLLRSTRVLETLAREPPAREFDRDLGYVRELGLDAATVVVSSDAIAAPGDLWARLDGFAQSLRGDGRKLVLWLQPPSVWYRSGLPSRSLAVQVLATAQRDLAVRFHPDVQVVVGDPIFASQLVGTATTRDSSRWAITALAESVRAGSSSTLVAAYGLDDADTSGYDLFRWAAADSSPVDRVGFALHPGFGDTTLFAERLDRATQLLSFLGPHKKAWVFEFGVCPVTFGELAQRNHLEWVLAWASADARIEGVSQTALGDYAEVVGLVSSLGRRREAFASYRQPDSHRRTISGPDR